ncbi:DUF2516 family protein [Cellulomonas palmilytica]|nr:DUF2516 family protein [Cellulomonas palmilytica]
MVGSLQWILYLLFLLAIFVLCVWALVDLLRRPASAFPAAGKRTKNFWLLIVGAATFLAFLGMPPLQIMPMFVGLLCAVAAIVYLVDVKPAVAPYSRRRGGGPTRSTGGW